MRCDVSLASFPHPLKLRRDLAAGLSALNEVPHSSYTVFSAPATVALLRGQREAHKALPKLFTLKEAVSSTAKAHR